MLSPRDSVGAHLCCLHETPLEHICAVFTRLRWSTFVLSLRDSVGAQLCCLHEIDLCRTESTVWFVYSSGSKAKVCSDVILGQNTCP